MPQGLRTPEGPKRAREDAEKKLALIKCVAEQNPNSAELAIVTPMSGASRRKGKFAVMISLPNAYPLVSDLSQIDEWYNRTSGSSAMCTPATTTGGFVPAQ